MVKERSIIYKIIIRFTFIDGDSVGNTITRVQHDTGGTTRSVERQDSLNGNVHGRGVESLEHDLKDVKLLLERIQV